VTQPVYCPDKASAEAAHVAAMATAVGGNRALRVWQEARLFRGVLGPAWMRVELPPYCRFCC
jgi:hypothetical protein